MTPVNLRVMTWFVNHQTSTACLFGREVDFPPQPNLWIVSILQMWPDLYQLHHPVDAFVVKPTPLNSPWPHGDQFHILLHQQPIEDQISVLTTTMDFINNDNPLGVHRAVVIPRHARRQDILHQVDLM